MHDRCPVTGAAATRMTRAGFARTCAAKRHERQGCDRVFTRCETCKGRPENWPPELTIIEMEATMTAKKPTKPNETELLAKLQMEAAKKEKLIERLAAMLGCLPGDIEQAMATMQGLVQEIRDIVEPEVAQYQCTTLPDACKQLVKLYRYEQTEAEGAKAQVKNLKAELSDAEAQIAKLEDEGREAWTILDGAGAGTLIEVAEKRWKEIEALQKGIAERDRQLDALIADADKRQKRATEMEDVRVQALENGGAFAISARDDGEAAAILHDLMRKLVDGRISLIHNHA